MARIHVKMSTGDEFTISEAFYGSQGPMDAKSARVQGSFLLTKMASGGTDQGPVINIPQISHYWIED